MLVFTKWINCVKIYCAAKSEFERRSVWFCCFFCAKHKHLRKVFIALFSYSLLVHQFMYLWNRCPCCPCAPPYGILSLLEKPKWRIPMSNVNHRNKSSLFSTHLLLVNSLHQFLPQIIHLSPVCHKSKSATISTQWIFSHHRRPRGVYPNIKNWPSYLPDRTARNFTRKTPIEPRIFAGEGRAGRGVGGYSRQILKRSWRGWGCESSGTFLQMNYSPQYKHLLKFSSSPPPKNCTAKAALASLPHYDSSSPTRRIFWPAIQLRKTHPQRRGRDQRTGA